MPRRLLLPILLLLVVGGLSISSGVAMAEFGFQSQGFDAEATNADGSIDVQAGSHPFQFTTSFRLAPAVNAFGEVVPSGNVKDVRVDLPPGLIGSAIAVPQCSQELFRTVVRETVDAEGHGNDNSVPSCSNSSVVGIIEVFFHPEFAEFVPVYSLVPPAGLPAEFGFNVQGAPVVLAPSLRTSGDYGLRVESSETSQALRVFASTVTFWGVPADPRHDEVRGSCLFQGNGHSIGERCPADAPRPLLRLPTSCTGPLTTTISADSWQEPLANPELWTSATSISHNSLGDPVGIGGCDRLDFGPSLLAQLETAAANSPTGMELDLSIPQNENPEGLAEADLRKAVVTLPAGVSISPSAANGLEACSEAQVGLHSTEPARCPNASKVGSVELETPLLEHALQGGLYVAQQNSNPYGSLLALYLVVEGSGVAVKLAGGVQVDPATGQLSTSFEERPQQQLSFPQLPFSKLRLRLYGGPRATLVTPRSCGSYQTTGLLTPWSSAAQVPTSVASPPFQIDSGCVSQFNPSFAAGTVSNQAGGFSPLVTTIARTDQDQDLGQVSLHTPPGLLGMLSKVTLCDAAQAELGTCSAASRIGHLDTSAGVGPEPVSLPQAGRQEDPVYLTGPYRGAPFGLAIVAHAEVGPFNLGTIVVRAAIYIDPHTAQITIVTDPLPKILKGIPLDVRSATVTIDRPEFTFNPTNCEPLAVTGAIASTVGANANVSTRFQAANCAALPFHPRFTVSTQSRTSRKKGASLQVKVTSGKGQANIGRVVVSLPKQLPARLTTLQKACTEAAFAANPATCPAASVVGSARAVTPLLGEPLTGPAYLVSHGRAAFPDLVVILEGEGIRLDLVGGTSIRKGITTSTFTTVPDAPVSSFELKLPEGSHSVLATNLPAKANGDLCGSRLVMPTTITGQNGARIVRSTRISISGCP